MAEFSVEYYNLFLGWQPLIKDICQVDIENWQTVCKDNGVCK